MQHIQQQKITNKRRVGNKDVMIGETAIRNSGTVDSSNTGRNSRAHVIIFSGRHEV